MKCYLNDLFKFSASCEFRTQIHVTFKPSLAPLRAFCTRLIVYVNLNNGLYLFALLNIPLKVLYLFDKCNKIY